MKKFIFYILSLCCLFSCSKNDYLDASVDTATVEFSSSIITETISFIANDTYDIAIPIQVFGGTKDATLNVTIETNMASDAYSIEKTKSIQKDILLDSLHLYINTNKLKKGSNYTIQVAIASSNIAVSNNYSTCLVTFSQQAFMDFFTGNYSCYESSTGSTYNVEFTKMNDTTIKNNNFYDFPLAGQYVPYIFTQNESYAIHIPDDYEWTDLLGNKFLVSGSGIYDLQGNFVVSYTMKDATSETIKESGTHTFKKNE